MVNLFKRLNHNSVVMTEWQEIDNGSALYENTVYDWTQLPAEKQILLQCPSQRKVWLLTQPFFLLRGALQFILAMRDHMTVLEQHTSSTHYTLWQSCINFFKRKRVLIFTVNNLKLTALNNEMTSESAILIQCLLTKLSLWQAGKTEGIGQNDFFQLLKLLEQVTPRSELTKLPFDMIAALALVKKRSIVFNVLKLSAEKALLYYRYHLRRESNIANKLNDKAQLWTVMQHAQFFCSDWQRRLTGRWHGRTRQQFNEFAEQITYQQQNIAKQFLSQWLRLLTQNERIPTKLFWKHSLPPAIQETLTIIQQAYVDPNLADARLVGAIHELQIYCNITVPDNHEQIVMSFLRYHIAPRITVVNNSGYTLLQQYLPNLACTLLKPSLALMIEHLSHPKAWLDHEAAKQKLAFLMRVSDPNPIDFSHALTIWIPELLLQHWLQASLPARAFQQLLSLPCQSLMTPLLQLSQHYEKQNAPALSVLLEALENHSIHSVNLSELTTLIHHSLQIARWLHLSIPALSLEKKPLFVTALNRLADTFTMRAEKNDIVFSTPETDLLLQAFTYSTYIDENTKTKIHALQLAQQLSVPKISELQKQNAIAETKLRTQSSSSTSPTPSITLDPRYYYLELQSGLNSLVNQVYQLTYKSLEPNNCLASPNTLTLTMKPSALYACVSALAKKYISDRERISTDKIVSSLIVFFAKVPTQSLLKIQLKLLKIIFSPESDDNKNMAIRKYFDTQSQQVRYFLQQDNLIKPAPIVGHAWLNTTSDAKNTSIFDALTKTNGGLYA